jgi:hypothetical protein
MSRQINAILYPQAIGFRFRGEVKRLPSVLLSLVAVL